MNQIKRVLISLFILGNFTTLIYADAVTPYFSIRSQGVNAVRDLVGWQTLINNCGMEDWYGATALTVEYAQSFQSHHICECLFGNAVHTPGPNSCKSSCSKDCSITISGSCVEGRRSTDWLADYFGLPTDFQSSVQFKPTIKNVIVDLQSYFGLDQLAEGLYFRIDFPVAYTRWNLNTHEVVQDSGGVNDYTQGYFTASTVSRQRLLNRATDFFSGEAVPDLLTGQPIPVTFQPLKFSKWPVSCHSGLSKTGLSQLALVLGYNVLCDGDYTFGINLRTEAPTGNKPEGEFLFEPIVGNGHHWTLGIGFNAHAILWRSDCDDSFFGFYLNANITHLFGTCQTRAFDLCLQGANSRYMLAQKLGSNTQELNGGTSLSDSQFINVFAPVANLTTSKVNVSASAQGDIALKFAYVTDSGFSFDIGYNFWGRTCEDIDIKKDCNAVTLTDWALKGDAHVYGFLAGTGEPIALAATENFATIYTGTNFATSSAICLPRTDPAFPTNTQPYLANINIDNAQLANITPGPIVVNESTVLPLAQTRTSIDPIVLNVDQINLASTHTTTQKLFFHVNYTWQDRWECVKPFLGVGGSAEFAAGHSCEDDNCSVGCATGCSFNCNNNNGSCIKCGLSQWSVWMKGGVAY